MNWEWVPLAPSAVAAVGIALNYNAPARMRAEVLEGRKIASECAVDDYRRLELQGRSDQRLTDYVWHTVHAQGYRRPVRGAWVIVLLASTCLLYVWVSPPSQSTPGWLRSSSVGLWAVALLASVCALLAVCRRAARKRADFEWNVGRGSRESDGDGPRRLHPTLMQLDEPEHR